MSIEQRSTLLSSIRREFGRRVGLTIFIFLVTSFVILGLGRMVNSQYQSFVIIGVRSDSSVVNHIDQTDGGLVILVSRLLKDPDVMARIAERAGLMPSGDEDAGRRFVAELRQRIVIKSNGNDAVAIRYFDDDPSVLHKVLAAVEYVLIEEAVSRQQGVEKSVLALLDEQVNAYEAKLKEAEEALSSFQVNVDSNASSVIQANVDRMRSQVSDERLLISELTAKKKLLQEKISGIELQGASVPSDLDKKLKQLDMLLVRLDGLKRTYPDTSPEVIDMRRQVELLKLEIELLSDDNARASESDTASKLERLQQLREQTTEVDRQLHRSDARYQQLQKALNDQYAKLEAAGTNQSKHAELLREYNVAKGIYDEFRSRGEKAHAEIAINAELERSAFEERAPVSPPVPKSKLSHIDIAILAPVAGVIAAIGMIFILAGLDRRIRSSNALCQVLSEHVELLGVVPAYRTPAMNRRARLQLIRGGMAFLFAAVIYGAVAYINIVGYDQAYRQFEGLL